jgi:quinohemoprotein ethanol dehydrogenase
MIPRTHSRFVPCEAVAILVVCWMIGTAPPGKAAAVSANVDGARISNADQDASDWLTYGRTYSEQRFSPLKRITASNAGQLGLAWYADLDTERGQEATPLVIDGVMYVSTAWSPVKVGSSTVAPAAASMRH